MSQRTILSAGALALAVTGSVIGASSASAEDYVGPNGSISSSCAGTLISHGKMYDATGKAHPSARWHLYAAGADGDTKCLTVADGSRGSHAMAAMVRPAEAYHDGAKVNGSYGSRTPAVSVKGLAAKCVGFTAEITDAGKFYQRNVESYACG